MMTMTKKTQQAQQDHQKQTNELFFLSIDAKSHLPAFFLFFQMNFSFRSIFLRKDLFCACNPLLSFFLCQDLLYAVLRLVFVPSDQVFFSLFNFNVRFAKRFRFFFGNSSRKEQNVSRYDRKSKRRFFLMKNSI